MEISENFMQVFLMFMLWCIVGCVILVLDADISKLMSELAQGDDARYYLLAITAVVFWPRPQKGFRYTLWSLKKIAQFGTSNKNIKKKSP